MISRFYADPDALKTFPRDLLDGSRETVRIAERIVREMGLEDVDEGPATSLADRLAWAIAAMEDGMPTGGADPSDRPQIRR